MNENDLRELVAKNISKLKPGLTLLQKEQYIPNNHGTKSFIDLYAKDENGLHILIELKRSNAAARQAIHEINKYTESVKRHFGVKDTEIHAIIASTEWTELLLPFSRFYSDARFSVEGIKININSDETDFNAEPVTPLKITQGRFIAPWHNMYWYTDKKALQRGITEIERVYRKKDIEDYIIVTFHLTNLLTEEENAAILKAQLIRLGVTDPKLSSLPLIPQHEYIAYTALQVLSKDECIHIISRDSNALSEALELLPGMAEEDALCYLHESVEALHPMPKCDYYEIGTQAKFSSLFNSEDYEICGMIRHGIFERNALLGDEILYSELKGEDGSTGQKFKRTVDVKNPAHIRALKEDISDVLKNNPAWSSQILRIIDDIGSELPGSEINIYVFNPSSGVFTIYNFITKEFGELYLPMYYILVKNPEVVCMYFGGLESSGSSMPFYEILKKYYDGELLELLLTATWGGVDSRDSDIIEDLGAQYRSYKADISNNHASDFFTLRDDKWRQCKKNTHIDLFNEYLKNNENLVKQILIKLRPHDKGVLWNMDNADLLLDEYTNMQKAHEKLIYYSNAPDVCDICKFPLSNEKFMIDGAVRNSKLWANMCGECFLAYGTKIGWGHGQLYLNNTKGWLLVGGFEPDLKE
ncbi:MAG: endonuclease NucS [Oscillospiraceae bacterium]|nr:endonuclease NucS [Oscillospiraceae bacterium]